MLNMSEHSDRNIEVHKFYNGAIFAVCVLALVFQAFLHKYGRWSELIDLPLLVTIYFGFSRRNPISGMFLGGVIGIAQDAAIALRLWRPGGEHGDRCPRCLVLGRQADQGLAAQHRRIGEQDDDRAVDHSD